MKPFFLIICSSFLFIQGCLKEPEISETNRPETPPTPSVIIETKTTCTQEESAEIIECEEDGKQQKFCTILRNETERSTKFGFYINQQLTGGDGESIFDKVEVGEITIGGKSPNEKTYFTECSVDGTSINKSKVYFEIKNKEGEDLETLEIKNNILCILEEHPDVKSCPRNGEPFKRCNTIKNPNSSPVVARVNFEVSHVNDSGNEVFQTDNFKNITIGPKSIYQMSYLSSCDVDNNLDEAIKASYIDSVKVMSFSKNTKSPKVKIRTDTAPGKNLSLFDPLPTGRCSLECDLKNPQPHCFVTTLSIDKKESVLYQAGISKINSILLRKQKIEPEMFLNSFGINVKPSCDISTFNFSDGNYIADGNNCGFKTRFLSGLNLVGNWEQSLSMRHVAGEKNQVTLSFNSGPYIWFEGEDSPKVKELNKKLAGDLLELELTKNGIYLSLPNACLVARVIEE